MPDPIDNSGAQTPGARSGTAQGGTVNAADAAAVVDAFNRAIPQLKSMTDYIDKMLEGLKAAEKTMSGVQKTAKDYSNELRQAMTYADDIEDRMKKINDFQKKLVRDGMKAKSYQEVLDVLKEMEKHNKQFVKDNILGDMQTRVMAKNANELRRVMDQVEKSIGDAFDKDKANGLLKGIEDIVKSSKNAAKAMKGLHMPGLKGDTHRAHRAVNHLFGSKHHERIQRYRDYAQTATEIRQARQAQHAGRTSEFHKRRDAILEKTKRHAQIFSKSYEDASDPEAKAGETATRFARKNGLGRFGSGIVGRYVKEDALNPGGKKSVLTRAGMSVLARGEGSIGKGIISTGLGALEGGASSLAEFAGPAAVALGGLELLKMGFNQNQKMNSEVAEGLGKGGIYSGEGNAIDSLRNVRRNLKGPLNPLNGFGIGYEKNLAIAKTIQENGFGTSNLSTSTLGMDKDGFQKGGYGQIQQNVYAYGRLAGLDSTQTVNETLKLVAQYKQSLESTHSFFVTITKDAETAGITTTKYIQILDDVNSHYERSNKLLEATVDTMKLLSVTGRNTAEDIKDAMDAVTNGGKQHDLPVAAYLDQNMLQDPEMRGFLEKARNQRRDNAVNQVMSTLPGLDRNTIMSGLNGGYKSASSTIAGLEQQAQAIPDLIQRQAASEAIKELRMAQAKRANLTNSKNGVDLASSDDLLGNDINDDKLQTFEMANIALKKGGFTMDDLLQGNPDLMTKNGGRVYQGVVKSLGGDPRKLQMLSNLGLDAATATADTIANIKPEQVADKNSDQAKLMDKTFSILEAAGKAPEIKPGQDKYGALSEAMKVPAMKQQIIQTLMQSGSVLQDGLINPLVAAGVKTITSQKELAAAKDKAAQLSAGTRDTAKIYADAFSSFFNALQTPLDYIAKLLAKLHPGETAQMNLDQFKNLLQTGQAQTSLDTYGNQINAVDKQIAEKKKTGGNTDDLDKKKRDLELKQAQIQYVKDHPNAAGAAEVKAANDAVAQTDYNYTPTLNEEDTKKLFAESDKFQNFKPGDSVTVDTNALQGFYGKAMELDKAKYTTTDEGQGKVTITYNTTNNSAEFHQKQEAQNALRGTGAENPLPAAPVKAGK